MSYGTLAEFRDADALLMACAVVRNEGFRSLEAYTPFPVEGLAEQLGMRRNAVAPITLAGGVLGAIGGYGVQYYAAVIDYPLNIGGRPLHSWPAFVPVAFELAVLGAALAAFLAVLLLNRLPRLVHPLFGLREFDLATRNRFFLCVRDLGPHPDAERLTELLLALGALAVTEVPA